MAFLPIARILPQYVDLNGDPASGFVLKAFAEGTSSQINFATDNTGSTLVGTIALNASGYPEVSGNEVIPHLDENYKLFLYPNQAAADADTGETWVIDNIIAGVSDLGGDELTNIGDGTARTSGVNVGQVQDNEFLCLGTTSGSADAYELTPSVPITAYAITQEFTVKIHATNTTTTPYLQISAIADPATTAVIKKLDASKAEIVSEPGDYTANGIYTFKRNSANTFWIGRDADIKEVIKVNSLIIPINDELTIATGVITITDSRHTVDTESDTSIDDLDTISGSTTGQILTLSTADDARDVVIKHATGNIITDTQTDITLGLTNDKVILQFDGTNWIVVSRSVNNDFNSSKVIDGFTSLPNGLIMQWGDTASISGGGSSAVSFPKTFPNSAFSVVLTKKNTPSPDNGALSPFVTSLSTSGFTANNDDSDSAYAVYWMAMGH